MRTYNEHLGRLGNFEICTLTLMEKRNNYLSITDIFQPSWANICLRPHLFVHETGYLRNFFSGPALERLSKICLFDELTHFLNPSERLITILEREL